MVAYSLSVGFSELDLVSCSDDLELSELPLIPESVLVPDSFDAPDPLLSESSLFLEPFSALELSVESDDFFVELDGFSVLSSTPEVLSVSELSFKSDLSSDFSFASDFDLDLLFPDLPDFDLPGFSFFSVALLPS